MAGRGPRHWCVSFFVFVVVEVRSVFLWEAVGGGVMIKGEASSTGTTERPTWTDIEKVKLL